jgi:hypothetical protein
MSLRSLYKLFEPNGWVDVAARSHSNIAAPLILSNTLPPLASNDLFGCVKVKGF